MHQSTNISMKVFLLSGRVISLSMCRWWCSCYFAYRFPLGWHRSNDTFLIRHCWRHNLCHLCRSIEASWAHTSVTPTSILSTFSMRDKIFFAFVYLFIHNETNAASHLALVPILRKDVKTDESFISPQQKWKTNRTRQKKKLRANASDTFLRSYKDCH